MTDVAPPDDDDEFFFRDTLIGASADTDSTRDGDPLEDSVMQLEASAEVRRCKLDPAQLEST